MLTAVQLFREWTSENCYQVLTPSLPPSFSWWVIFISLPKRLKHTWPCQNPRGLNSILQHPGCCLVQDFLGTAYEKEYCSSIRFPISDLLLLVSRLQALPIYSSIGSQKQKGMAWLINLYLAEFYLQKFRNAAFANILS